MGINVHTGLGTDYEHLTEVYTAMKRIVNGMDCNISAISAGRGLPIPYKQDDPGIDVVCYYEAWSETQSEIERFLKHRITLEI